MSYIGIPPFGQTVRTVTEATATAGQTTFNITGGYVVGYVDVFLNGVLLAASDFTATNGTTVVLGTAAALNDEFQAIAYQPVSLMDTYRKSEVDSLLAAKQSSDSELTTLSGMSSDRATFLASTNDFAFRNRIINGDMRIDQRNAGAAVTAANAYPVDRFNVGNSTDGAFSAQQDSSAPAGFVNSVKVTITTSDATLTTTQTLNFRQSIEGTNISDLAWGTANAKTVTLSFWVRSSLTGTFGGSVRNSASDRSYPFTYSISVADTWEQKTVIIAGDTTGTWLTTTGVGLTVFFSLGSGPDRSGTAGAWAGANYISATGAVSVIGTLNATWYITGVQLEVGSVATPFERRPYGTELALCQRYFWKSTSTNSGNARISMGLAFSSTATSQHSVMYPVEMRAAPTINTLSGNYIYNPVDGGYTITGLNLDGATAIGTCLATVGSSGLTAQRSYSIFNATINFSAEL